MIRIVWARRLLMLQIMVLSSYLHSTDVIRGDSQDPQQTFVQPISVFSLSRFGDFFYAGARTAGAQSYALACLPHGADKFIELTPQKVNINGTLADNPLYDQPISLLTLLGENYHPVVIQGNRPADAFFIDSFSNPEKIEMLATINIISPDKNPTSGIIALAATNSGRGGHVFAAVKNSAEDPLGVGSGIALLAAHFMKQGENDHFVFNQLSVVPFTTATPELIIGSPVTFLGTDVVDMHWDDYLGCLYIALQLEAGASGTDGVKAVCIGTIKDNAISFRAIGPDELFQGTDKIVGARGAQEQVSLHKVKTMLTSTSLQYLIVLGGNGSPATTRRSVFALPLVNNPKQTDIHGTLASKNALPEDRFSEEKPYRLIARGFTVAATNTTDAVTDTDLQALVGCGDVSDGDITDIFVKDDAVFAVVSQADLGKRPGIFYSRALFDQYGRIKAWTEWRRVSGSVEDLIFGAALEPTTGNFIFLTGNDQDSVNTVKRTIWGNGDNEGLGPLGKVFGATFPRARGGIHGLFDIPAHSPGLDDISLLLATGCQTVSLVQTSTFNGSFEPTVGEIFETNKEVFNNGIIDRPLPTGSDALRVLTISGGELKQLNFINAAEIATAGDKAWLFVGGNGGLAVLTRDDGAGWDDPPGLGSGFAGLQIGTEFKKISSYKYVQKLVYDDAFLYVLTNIKLDRIDLLNSNFATGDLVVTTIAAVGVTPRISNCSTLFDLIISEKLGLLATSDGLFRIANGKDIRTAHATDWKQVSIPEGCGSVIQLCALSKTGREQDVARFVGGDLYALVAYSGKNRAQTNRFSIKPVDNEEITDETIQPLPDLFVKNISSYFVSFGQFRNWIVSDGALFFHEINRNLCDDPAIYLLSGRARSGIRFLADKNPPIPLTFHDACFLLPLVRNSATGAWLLAGNDGLRINE